jgi:hypothetical protein
MAKNSKKEEKKVEDLKEGFRVGDYFCTFPPGEFIKEDEDGNMFAMVDIFKIDQEGRATKVNGALTPELEDAIGEELNRLLTQALELAEKENINK